MLALGSALALPATAANLIPNPDFTNGVDGWTTITAGNGTATLDSSTGAPDAPSIRLVANPANWMSASRRPASRSTTARTSICW